MADTIDSPAGSSAGHLAVSTLVVGGYLGTGKSRLVERLTGAGAPNPAAPFDDRACGPVEGTDTTVIEASPFRDPRLAAGPAGRRIAVTADAVNLAALVRDPDVADLVVAQIRAADVVVLTCSDVADPAPAMAALHDITDAPIVDAQETADLGAALLGMPARGDGVDAPLDLTSDIAVWTYAGPAVLSDAVMGALLTARPDGPYRIRGHVRLTSGGGIVDVFGRARRTAAAEVPAETRLIAAGPAGRFSVRAMDLAFAEAVTASTYDRGLIACR